MLKLKYFTLTLTVLFLTALNAPTLMAESYQHDLTAFYFNEKGDDTEMNGYAAEYQYNFQEVILDGKPYDEAAFLQKVSYLSVNGQLIIIKVSYDRLQTEGSFVDTGYDVDMDGPSSFYGCQIGYYLFDEMTVGIKYERSYINYTYDWSGGSFDSDTTSNTFGAEFKYVFLFNNGMGISLSGSWQHESAKNETTGEADTTEKNNIYSIYGIFYINQKIGIGCLAEFNSGDNKYTAGNIFGLEANIYFTPNIAVSAGYTIFKADDTDTTEDTDTIRLAIKGRI